MPNCCEILSAENIICIKDLGIQMSTVYFTGKTLQEFIPQAFIADCVINEVIYSVCHQSSLYSFVNCRAANGAIQKWAKSIDHLNMLLLLDFHIFFTNTFTKLFYLVI